MLIEYRLRKQRSVAAARPRVSVFRLPSARLPSARLPSARLPSARCFGESVALRALCFGNRREKGSVANALTFRPTDLPRGEAATEQRSGNRYTESRSDNRAPQAQPGSMQVVILLPTPALPE
jgi:hypothetical protein